MDEAGRIESAVMKLAMKNKVPSFLSAILNLSWKKNVIQELGTISWIILLPHGKDGDEQWRQRTSE